MSRKNPILGGVRKKLAGVLASAANRVDAPKSEPKEPAMDIHNYTASGRTIIVDISKGRISYKVMNNGVMDRDMGDFIRDRIEKVLGDDRHKSVQEYGVQTFMDPYVAMVKIYLQKEYLSGEEFSKLILDTIADSAQEYGYDIKVIGADRMQTFKIPAENIAGHNLPSGAQAEAAHGVERHDKM